MPLALIVAVTVLAHAAFNGSRVTVSLYALSLGASSLTVGVLMSLYAALPMLLGVATGRLVDRVGIRAPLVAGTAILSVAVLAPGVLGGLAPLYATGAAAGLGFMLFHIAIQHAVGEMSAEADRASNFGWLALGFSISGFVGPTLAGFAIDGLGHGNAFRLLAVLALAALAVVLGRRHALPRPPASAGAHAGSRARHLLRDRHLRAVFVVTGLLAAAWDLFIFVMPIHGTAIGLPASTIGLILGSFALATFTVRLALPWLGRRLREWTMLTATLLVAAFAYALLPAVTTVPLLATIAFVLGLGLGAAQPSIMSILYAVAPPGRAGEAVGVRATVLNASHTVLPLAFGGVGAALGLGPVFWSMAACLGAGGWAASRRARKR